MRHRFDQLFKRVARTGYGPAGQVETDAEVSPDSMRIDVWFIPAPEQERARKVLAPLGLFGRMGRTSCTLEPFHNTPSGARAAECLMKHMFFCRELQRRAPPPPTPTQWIISSGRPSAALSGFRFLRSRRGRGIYEGPPMMRTHLVVVSELPRTRDTLLVRLMGAGRTLKHAIEDLQALPEDAPERRLALPILVQLRLEIPTDPAKQTKIDREFLMTTRDVEKYLEALEAKGREKGIKEGLKTGREEGREALVKSILTVYRARFGEPSKALVAAVEQATDLATLECWVPIVATRSANEVAAALIKPRPTRTTRRLKTTPRVSPRRAAASR